MDDVGARLEARILVRVAIVLWMMTALATVWETLALQAPDSPLHVGILVGPIVQLRDQCFAQGAGLFLAAVLWPVAHGQQRGLLTLVLLLSGTLFGTVALVYAAKEGIMGAQIFDPRQDAQYVLMARGAGLTLWLMALIDLFVRSFRVRS